jgi:hypothetical protein
MGQNIEEIIEHLRQVESKLQIANYHLIEAKRMILEMEKK